MHTRYDHCPPNPILIGQQLRWLGHQRCSRLPWRQHIQESPCLPCNAVAHRRHIRTSNLTALHRTCTWRRWRDVAQWSWRGCKLGWDSHSLRGGTATLDLLSWRSSPNDVALCLSEASNNVHIPTAVTRQWTRKICGPSPPQLDSSTSSQLHTASLYLGSVLL